MQAIQHEKSLYIRVIFMVSNRKSLHSQKVVVQSCTIYNVVHRESKKRRRYTLVHIFAKY